MNVLLAALLSLFTVFVASGCGGGEAPGPQTQTGAAARHADVPPVEKPVVEAPEIIKGRWKAVVLVVNDKKGGKSSELTVTLSTAYKVPGTDLTVDVKEFFPSFVMQGSSITSSSNEPNNPAALVTVSEGGSEIFSGWLFARFPTTHAFSHPKYSIILKEGVPK